MNAERSIAVLRPTWIRVVRLLGALMLLAVTAGGWAWQQRWLGRGALSWLVPLAIAGALFALVPGIPRRREQLLVATLLLALLPLSAPWQIVVGQHVRGPEPWSERRDRLVGRQAPDFTLKDLEGRSFRLSDYRGRVVVVERWRTWCGPCVEQLPYLEYALQSLGADGLMVVTLSDEPSAMQRTVRDQLGLTLRMLTEDVLLPNVYTQDARFPATFLIDRDGTFRDGSSLRGYAGLLTLSRVVRGSRAGSKILPPLEERPTVSGPTISASVKVPESRKE